MTGIGRSTAGSTLIVTAGNVVVMGVGLLSTILLMQTFKPDGYGVITTLITLMTVLPVFMDFGTSVSILRFGPMFEEKGLLDKKSHLFRSMLYIRTAVGAVLLILGLFFVKPVSRILFDSEEYAFFISVALVGSLAISFVQYVTGLLQAEEKFVAMTGVKAFEGLLKLAMVLLLVFGFSDLDPGYAIVIYCLAPLLTIAAVLSKAKLGFLRGPLHLDTIRTLFKFSFWYMIASVCLMIFMNLDVLILAALKPQSEVGYFGSGNKIASILYLFVSAIYTVLLPKVGRKISRDKLKQFIAKSMVYCVLASLLLTPVCFLGTWIVPLFAGQDYVPAIPVFTLSAVDHIVMILFTPFMLILFAINRPKIFALFTALEMLLNIVGDLVFIPFWGALGAVAVTLGVRVIIGLAGSFYLVYRFRRDAHFIRDMF